MELFREDVTTYLNSLDSTQYQIETEHLSDLLFHFTKRISDGCIFNPVYVHKKIKESYQCDVRIYQPSEILTELETILLETVLFSGRSGGYFITMQFGYPTLCTYKSALELCSNGYMYVYRCPIDKKTGLRSRNQEYTVLETWITQINHGKIPILFLCCEESVMNHIMQESSFRDEFQLNSLLVESINTPLYEIIMSEWQEILDAIKRVSIHRKSIIEAVAAKFNYDFTRNHGKIQLDYIGLCINSDTRQLHLISTESTMKFRPAFARYLIRQEEET